MASQVIIMSYKNLEIWQLSSALTIRIHKMSLELPKLEQFEEGQQIRRSIKSLKSTIRSNKMKNRIENIEDKSDETTHMNLQ